MLNLLWWQKCWKRWEYDDNDDNWVICCWRQPSHESDSAGCIYKSCSQSGPSLSLCINHRLWSHWIKFLYPPTPPTTLNMKTGQHRNENDKIGGISRKSLFPMNIHEMRSAVLQRKRATELFPAVSWIAIYIKAGTVQIKHVWMQNQMSPRDKILEKLCGACQWQRAACCLRVLVVEEP